MKIEIIISKNYTGNSCYFLLSGAHLFCGYCVKYVYAGNDFKKLIEFDSIKELRQIVRKDSK